MDNSSKNNQTAYLFDVDGVLTDPVEKRVIEPELLEYILKFLSQGNPVAFNTGRALEWTVEKVVTTLFTKAKDKDIFTRFIVIGEKGETWMVWDNEGRAYQETTEGLTMPQRLVEVFRRLIEKEYNDVMFFDSTKTVMITAEMKDNYDIQQFQARKNKFIEELQLLLKNLELEKVYAIHKDDISVSVEHTHVGKALGTKRFMTFLNDRHFEPKQFYCFGDTTTDFEMADELHTRGKDVTFVYTGDKKQLGEITKPYLIEFAAGYTRGTLAYLKSLVKDLDEHRS